MEGSQLVPALNRSQQHLGSLRAMEARWREWGHPRDAQGPLCSLGTSPTPRQSVSLLPRQMCVQIHPEFTSGDRGAGYRLASHTAPRRTAAPTRHAASLHPHLLNQTAMSC